MWCAADSNSSFMSRTLALISKSKLSMQCCRLGVLLIFSVGSSINATAQTWIKLSTTGEPPTVRSGAIIAVYDATSNRLITFGGNTITPCCTAYNDVWILTNANGLGGTAQWIKLNPIGPAGFPSPRGHHSAVYDAANNRMIIFGGGQWNEISRSFFLFVPRFNDAWVLTNANGLGGTPEWIPLSSTGGLPSPRETARAVYDPGSNRMTIFGGGNNGLMDVPNDVWVLTNANGLGGPTAWIQLNPIGQIPAAAQSHAATYDPLTNRMTIFAGSHPSFSNGVYVLTNANGLGGTPEWIQLFPSGELPAPRGTHTYGYDPLQNRLVVFGAGNSGGVLNDTWVLSNANGLGGPPTWTNRIPNGAPGSPPAENITGGGLYDAVNNRLIQIRSGPDVPTEIGLEVWVLIDAANNSPVAQCKNVTLTTDNSCQAIISTSDINDGSWDPEDGASVTLSVDSTGPFGLGQHVVTLTATDNQGTSSSCSATVTVADPAPVVSITAPLSGSIFTVNTDVSFSGSFTDNPGANHAAQWMLGNITQTGAVNESNGTVSATYNFATVGVYAVKLTVADSCGGLGVADQVDGLAAMVVIYDPNGGFVTGGGWFNSPAGAYTINPSLTGRANFGFVSKYLRGASVPTGETEFQFQIGNFTFHSSTYDWLVIGGARAQYKGSGTINGSGNYGFILTAIDGQVNGGGGADRFRIKIWDKNNGDTIIYDNQMGSSDSADPLTLLKGGSIVIHR